MSDAKTQAAVLKADIEKKIRELGKFAVENNLDVYLDVCDSRFYVFNEQNYDEDDLEYYQEEFGLENGMWYSSSQMC